MIELHLKIAGETKQFTFGEFHLGWASPK